VKQKYKSKPNNKQCCVCGAVGARRIDIQTNCFRGDDVVVNVCDEHRKDEKTILATPQARKQM